MATLTITNGYFDGNNFFPNSGVNWQSLGSSPYTTWASWTTWVQNPPTLTVKVLEDQLFKDSRLPLVTFIWEGSLTLTLKIGDTVDSNLNIVSPTTTTLAQNTGYSPVAGRYYEYTFVLATDSNTVVPFMGGPIFTYDSGRQEEFLENVNTATLSGSIDARVVDTQVGTVTALVATAREQGVTYSSGTLRDRVYAIPDDYTFQENAIIVNVVSKSNKTIRCFDLNGESIDAVVDIWVQGLPKMIFTKSGGVTRT
jgi:hypothetical protein